MGLFQSSTTILVAYSLVSPLIVLITVPLQTIDVQAPEKYFNIHVVLLGVAHMCLRACTTTDDYFLLFLMCEAKCCRKIIIPFFLLVKQNYIFIALTESSYEQPNRVINLFLSFISVFYEYDIKTFVNNVYDKKNAHDSIFYHKTRSDFCDNQMLLSATNAQHNSTHR